MTTELPPSTDPSESSRSDAASEPNQPTKPHAPFPVVGIAASAGGLEAFIELISHLPADTGMGFVLIQHLAPDHESLLPEILGRVTTMPVRQVRDRMRVKPNVVYVIPPNAQMTLVNGSLRLAPRQKLAGKYLPADIFFESLAADCGDKAIAIVLSGMDGDGAQGIKAIKVAGGITFAQSETTAQFDTMPNTAVATGRVDFVLPPQTIAAELVNLSRNLFWMRPEPLPIAQALPFKLSDPLAQIFSLLRTTMGVDFTQYKPATLDRRIQRRMILYKLDSLEEYAQYLQTNREEIQALHDEILIHVTRFFRDPQAFEQLKTRVFPSISQAKSSDVPIRIWIPGCSTGEEVYTIAICLLEFLSDRATIPSIQIFATDISETAISKARSGFYGESQMEGISPERQSRFFVPIVGGGYQISSTVRELCVFARHDLAGDPPFSNLDLISCRNVLIYLSDALQERIMGLFHYSLNLTGFLLLGPSESIKNASNLFMPVDESSKIYARKLTLSRPLFAFTPSSLSVSTVRSQPQVSEHFTTPSDLAREVDQLISNRYAPTSVVVDGQMHILHMRGDLDPYLKLTPGTTELNLLSMAREGLEIPLRTALYQAQTQNLPVRQEQIQLEGPDQTLLLNIEVLPFRPALATATYFLVFFNVVSPPAIDPSPAATSLEPVDLEREIVSLRQALAASTQRELSAQARLQAMMQEQIQLNQNLRVANEEILSSNEELQSTNEELQTAKEEIQATNEELSTTNEELRSRNLQQNRDNSDLSNFIAGINIPIVMLTNELRIRRFTPTAQRLFNFIPTDIGRPFTDLHGNFDVSQLEPMILEVLETLNTLEQEIQTAAGDWYSLRIRPYRTTENQIDGVTLVFLDIDTFKRNAATLEAARNYAETIIETVPIPLLVLDADLRVNTANRAFYETFQVSESETLHTYLFELGNGQWNIPPLRSRLDEILAGADPIQNFEFDHDFEQIGQKTMLLNACKLNPEGDVDLILMAIADITDRKQLELERLRLQQEQLARQQAEATNRAKDEFLANLSHELRNPLTSLIAWAELLHTGTPDPATMQRGLEAIQRSAFVQNQLIGDILDVSRIAAGNLRLNSHPIDLSVLIQAVLDNAYPLAAEKTIQLVPVLSAITVFGDAERLHQVLWNLLTNAIKFTPAGGRVDITLSQVGNQAQVQVRDTGQGIAAEVLPHIFDRFYQVDSSPTKASEGLGLGLAIVRNLVELHGGTVEAESPGVGQGTTLTVRLPPYTAASSAPPLIEPTLVPLANPSSEAPSLAGLQILLVDDQPAILTVAQIMLEDYGAQVTAVTTARDAIAALTERPGSYDVLVSDIGMPNEDGYFLIGQVRSLSAEQGGQIPAIALTGYTGNAEQQHVIEAGFQRHVSKPINFVRLGSIIAELANRT